MSGPAVSGGAVALPGRLLRAPVGRAARARTGALLDALLHGRGWIALVGLLLAGIVFFNVDLLQLNRSIAATAGRTAGLKRENSRLRLELARLGSVDRIQEAAAGRGLVLPAPSDVRYLRARPGDARRAVKVMTPPGEGALAAPVRPLLEPAPQAPQQPQAPPGAPVAQSPVQPQSGMAPQTQAQPQAAPQAPPASSSPAGGVAPPATGTP